MKKLTKENDLALVRINNHLRGLWIPVPEMREVNGIVGDTAYYLYSYYRTNAFHEYAELTDEEVGEAVGWLPTKVKKYRLVLEKAGMFLVVPYGSRSDRVYKVFVGADVVALHNAGLPAKIVEGKAFNKLKKKFNITTPKELIKDISLIMDEFNTNPDLYL